ncbi:BRO family protein [Aeromonas veronii]|uniref:BRO family protein n=1 Tax=Aeromonas veronii TaxID=654 RepID=UPI000E1F45FB|nr:BRO family protein [Aeromonas veronii]RDU77779.1 hypothetical protein CHF44_21610 [Aeromonas veronii]RDU87617.1 hypothetical protein CHH34_20795 [Aeromonas veronii]
MQTTISNIFHFDGYKQIRTLTRPEDDSVLFCGKDVAEALGYKKPELQHAITAHTEAQLKRMLDRLDRLDYYGTASKEAKASIAEKVAKEFNQPVELIEAIQRSGLAGAKVA